jgi:hypothetical protein
MNTQEAIQLAARQLDASKGYVFDVLTLEKPTNVAAGVNLVKILSKLSPLLGNLIEFNIVELLNAVEDFKPHGHWVRQDPDFPDALFVGNIDPPPGLEIKAWYPLATEITARFKDSQNHFANDQTYVALLAWLPEKLIYGRPQLIDVCVTSGRSVAEARDEHYHSPPGYLILEPEDTAARTRNLRQTNTNGYKWQGTTRQYTSATEIVRGWGAEGTRYLPTRDYQLRLRELLARFPYRLDTNFAKMDRIQHDGIEQFKSRVLGSSFLGKRIADWAVLLTSRDEGVVINTLQHDLGVKI